MVSACIKIMLKSSLRRDVSRRSQVVIWSFDHRAYTISSLVRQTRFVRHRIVQAIAKKWKSHIPFIDFPAKSQISIDNTFDLLGISKEHARFPLKRNVESLKPHAAAPQLFCHLIFPSPKQATFLLVFRTDSNVNTTTTTAIIFSSLRYSHGGSSYVVRPSRSTRIMPLS